MILKFAPKFKFRIFHDFNSYSNLLNNNCFLNFKQKVQSNETEKDHKGSALQ